MLWNTKQWSQRPTEHVSVWKINGTSKTGVSCWTRPTLGAVSEVSAVAQRPRGTSVGWVVGFGGTRRTHKPRGFKQNHRLTCHVYITDFSAPRQKNLFLNLNRLRTPACSPHPGLSEQPVCRPSLRSTPCNQPARPDPPGGWRSLVDRAQGRWSPQDRKSQQGIWDNPSHLEETVTNMLRLYAGLDYTETHLKMSVEVSVVFFYSIPTDHILKLIIRFPCHLFYSGLTAAACHQMCFYH